MTLASSPALHDQDINYVSEAASGLSLFQWGVVAALAALVVGLCVAWAMRIVLLRGQEVALSRWALAHAFVFRGRTSLDTVMDVLPFGRAASSSETGSRLFAGFAARPPMWSDSAETYGPLLESADDGVRIWQSRVLAGSRRRPPPRTLLGQVVRYRFMNLVGVDLERELPTVLVVPKPRMRIALFTARRLRVRTGEASFDSRFAVLALDAEAAKTLLDRQLRMLLCRAEVPAKSSVVFEGRTCYVSQYGPLRASDLDVRCQLVRRLRQALS
ncbi:hypothetical protein [Natronoglycomyces albus]|uniref:DUF3137 domain-containing protein n=1 Tax=Natronoglycomyces albus TaxID=2811108 RepID=A0A895XTY6_9ACTN|nr:hypothetical protein [Natronoglycomyces albus]QSB05108.1 hypothetical protein JQS30_15325 [Natronoglycomyces albus]